MYHTHTCRVIHTPHSCQMYQIITPDIADDDRLLNHTSRVQLVLFGRRSVMCMYGLYQKKERHLEIPKLEMLPILHVRHMAENKPDNALV